MKARGRTKSRKASQIQQALGLVESFLSNPRLKPAERVAGRLAEKYLRELTEGRRSIHLTPQEVARRFGVTPVTVRLWARQGQIAAITTPGGHRRFPLADIERFARSVRR